VTWESLVGLDETNFWPLLGQSYGSQQAINNASSVWTVSQAAIQEWLDDEQTNFGLALYPDSGNANAFLQTRAAGPRGPTLEFCVIPEPGVAAGLLLAAVACLRARRG
jgi:hypothetical protein